MNFELARQKESTSPREAAKMFQSNRNPSEPNFPCSSNHSIGDNRISTAKIRGRLADACRRGSSGSIDTFRRYSSRYFDVALCSITRPRDHRMYSSFRLLTPPSFSLSLSLSLTCTLLPFVPCLASLDFE